MLINAHTRHSILSQSFYSADNDLEGNYKKLISKEWIKCLVQYLEECYLRIRSCRVLFYSLKCL